MDRRVDAHIARAQFGQIWVMAFKITVSPSPITTN